MNDNSCLQTLPILILNAYCRCNCRCAMCDIWRVGRTLEFGIEDWRDKTMDIESLGVRQIVFSGGEPLMQFDFLKALLTACRRLGLRTAVDTCGQAKTHQLLAIAPLTDLFLFDLKLMNDQAHRRYTGTSNRLILHNLRQLAQAHPLIWLRIPLIAGLNDSPAELRAVARFAASLPGVRQINLLGGIDRHLQSRSRHDR